MMFIRRWGCSFRVSNRDHLHGSGTTKAQARDCCARCCKHPQKAAEPVPGEGLTTQERHPRQLRTHCCLETPQESLGPADPWQSSSVTQQRLLRAAGSLLCLLVLVAIPLPAFAGLRAAGEHVLGEMDGQAHCTAP